MNTREGSHRDSIRANILLLEAREQRDHALNRCAVLALALRLLLTTLPESWEARAEVKRARRVLAQWP